MFGPEPRSFASGARSNASIVVNLKDMNTRVHFGHRLRHWRRTAGLTQAELGRQLAYDHSYISRVETGSRWPTMVLADRCDSLLGAGGDLLDAWRRVADERESLLEPDPVAVACLATLLTGQISVDERTSRWLAAAPRPLLGRLLAMAADALVAAR